MTTNLQTPIDYLKGVGPNRADLLRKELGIHTYQDLINLFLTKFLNSNNNLNLFFRYKATVKGDHSFGVQSRFLSCSLYLYCTACPG